MIKHFKLYVILIMITFSLFMSFTVAIVDHNKLKNRLYEEHRIKIHLIEDTVLRSLQTMDQAYSLFDKEIKENMKKESEELVTKYKSNPDFETWNFDQIKEQIGMDIYIIDENQVISHTSFVDDIGLNFNECCKKFAQQLEARRMKGEFIDDGIDIQQSNGEIKKFSYAPTPDKKFIIELGYSLEQEEVIKLFNYENVIAELEDKYDLIYSISVYNSGGLLLNEKLHYNGALKITKDRYDIFRHVVKTGVVAESEGRWNSHRVKYRYVPYEETKDDNVTTNKVIEVVYNEDTLINILEDYRKDLLIQLIIILTVAVFISLIIARMVARPMHLAFHDSLTGLKNRAAFEEQLAKRLKNKKDETALLMIDLDNFKQVNDQFGHSKGDYLLKVTAEVLTSCAGERGMPARLGGDEFAVILSCMSEEETEQIASMMLEQMNGRLVEMHINEETEVTFSIGIAFANEEDNVGTLYNKADHALYKAKDSGKNQYKIYL